MKFLHWFGLARYSELFLAERRAEILEVSNDRLSEACYLNIEEIKRLEEELAQARADRDIKHARRSEASRKGWEKRRAA